MTPSTSPQKKRMPAMDSSRRASGTLTLESTATAAAVLGFSGKTIETRSGRATVAGAVGLLPTPAKTPQKPPSPKTQANIAAVRRNLFHHDEVEVELTPKKTRGTKHVLDSFAADDDESIPIFTDSKERIPEIDASIDNPFYAPQTAAAPEPARRRSKRVQLVTVPGEGKITVEEAVQREDGMLIVLYVFAPASTGFTELFSVLMTNVDKQPWKEAVPQVCRHGGDFRQHQWGPR
jgi:hypothetical protein